MHTTEIWCRVNCQEDHPYGDYGWRPCTPKEMELLSTHEHKFVVAHHGDYSGDIQITDLAAQTCMTLPFDVVMELVGQMVQSEMIEQLEAESGSGTLRRIAGGQP